MSTGITTHPWSVQAGRHSQNVNLVQAAETLAPSDRINILDLATAAADYTVTLPPAAECAGLLFAFTTTGTGYNVTVADAGKSADWDGNVVMGDDATDSSKLLLLSDGRKWWTVHETVLS